MKVFIVTSGEYSDYRVEAIFSTREKAEDAIACGCLKERIEEMDLDPEAPHIDLIDAGWREWIVVFRGDGRITAEELSKHSCYECANDFGDWMVQLWEGSGDIEVMLWANSKERALKSATEKRAYFLANPALCEKFGGETTHAAYRGTKMHSKEELKVRE